MIVLKKETAGKEAYVRVLDAVTELPFHLRSEGVSQLLELGVERRRDGAVAHRVHLRLRHRQEEEEDGGQKRARWRSRRRHGDRPDGDGDHRSGPEKTGCPCQPTEEGEGGKRRRKRRRLSVSVSIPIPITITISIPTSSEGAGDAGCEGCGGDTSCSQNLRPSPKTCVFLHFPRPRQNEKKKS